MTIAELHAQLTELCNKGHGGARVFGPDKEHDFYPIDHLRLLRCDITKPETNWQYQLELAHGETFLMLE